MFKFAEVFLIAFLASLRGSESVVYKKEHSFTPPFHDHSDIFRKWYFTGSAELHPDFIRLTKAEPVMQGAIWSSHACFSKDWEIQIHFHIHGNEPFKYGDGIAIWYAKEPLKLGTVFGSKDYFTGLGIFIDTHQNLTTPHKHLHPYISAVVNNGTFGYKHDSDGTFMELGSCHVPVRNPAPEITTAIAISYIQKTLIVFTDTDGTMHWKPCFKAENVHLPTGYYFGISASTGWLKDFHDIVAMTTLDMSPEEQEPEGVDENQVLAETEIAEDSEDDAEAEAEDIKVKEQQKIKASKKEVHPEEALFEPKPKAVEKTEIDMGMDIKSHQAEQIKTEERKTEQSKARETKKEEIKSEEKKKGTEEPRKTSLLRILIYIAITTAVLIFAARWCARYNDRRNERIRKRLY